MPWLFPIDRHPSTHERSSADSPLPCHPSTLCLPTAKTSDWWRWKKGGDDEAGGNGAGGDKVAMMEPMWGQRSGMELAAMSHEFAPLRRIFETSFDPSGLMARAIP